MSVNAGEQWTGDGVAVPRWVSQYGWLLVVSFVLALPINHLFELPMALMAVMGLWLVLTQRDAVVALPAFKPLLIMSAGIWVPMLVSLPDAVNFPRATETTVEYLRFFMAAIFTIFALQTLNARQKLSRWLGLALSLAAICVIVFTLQGDASWFSGVLSKVFKAIYETRAIGHILAVLSPIYFYWSWKAGQQRRWVSIVAPSVFAMAILFSGSRVAWIMLGVSAVLMLLQLLLIEKIQWRWKHFIAYSLAFVLAMWIGVYQNPVLKMKVEQTTGVFSGNYTQTDVATSGRLPIWRTAINVIKSNWINGIGPRGFRYVYSEYAEKGDPYVAKNPHVGPTHPHQMFLEIATETGLLGVIGYLIAQFYWLQLGLVAVRAKMSAVLPWMTAVLIAIMPINSHMAFYASFWSSITWWLIMISLAYWQADFLEKKSSQS